MPRVTAGARIAACAIALALMPGCTMIHHAPPALLDLMSAYRAENGAVALRRDSVEQSRIRLLKVSPDSASRGQRLSADVEEAALPIVVRSIVRASGMAFTFGNVVLTGRTTARFTDLPIIDGLNALIGPSGYVAVLRNGLISVQYGTPPFSQGERGTDTVTTEVGIYHLDAKAMAPIVDSMVRIGSMRTAYVAARSVLLLTGTRKEVTDAVATIRRVDRPTPHVFMEALVVEFDVETLEQLSVSASDGSRGSYSDAAYNPGSLTGDLLSFVRTFGAVNPTKFTAYIRAVAGENKARIIARPYITTRSGEPANLDIGRQRTFLTTLTGTTGGFVTQANSVQVASGVVLRMTPTVLPGERIRVDLHLEESEFIPTTDNIAAERDVNVAESSMQVASGETIVIGGLMVDRSTANVTGIPLLWRLPLIGNLFRSSDKSGKQQQVVLFVTPRIWDPVVDAPLVKPEAFENSTWQSDSRPKAPAP